MKDLAFRIFVSLIYVRENVYFWDFSNKIGPDPTHTDSKSLKKYVFNRVSHQNMFFRKKINPTHSRGIWVVG